MVGEQASKRMQTRLEEIRQRKKAKTDDEEIVSEDSDDVRGHNTDFKQNRSAERAAKILNDPFLQVQEIEQQNEEEKNETAEEKRLRLANQIIEEYAQEEKTDFFD